jgi:type VI secretion system protein VasJ
MEKTEGELEKLKPGPIPEEQAARIQANIKALDDQLVDKMPDPPLLRPVQRQIERIPVQAPGKKEPPPREAVAQQQVKEAPAPAPKPAAPQPDKPAPDVAVPQAIESEQDARKSVDGAIVLLRKASHFLIQQDLKNPLAYRYRRLASWAKIESPPLHTDGLTQIPPPAPMIIGALTDLRDEGNWSGLIQNAEQKVSQFVFWFDLNCMVAEGLKQMGPDYQNALDAVCYETACFFQRFAGVEKLSFADGTPFAEAQTLKWLKAIRWDAGSGGQVAGAVSSDADDAFNAVVRKALAMGRKKQLVQAVDLLQKQMLSCTSRCRQLRWRLAIVQVLVAVKKPQLAMPHLDQIIADIDAFNLEEWDPAVALEGLTAAWKGYNAQNAKEQKVRAVEILNRIARINPAQALRMVNK